MSKKLFSEREIEILASNKYVKSVSEKTITYTDEFKRIVVTENKKGKLPRQIFEECGFDIDIIGRKRMQIASDRWRAAYRESGIDGLKDTRKINSGRSNQ